MAMINYRPVFRILGILVFLLGVMMLTGLPVSWYFQSDDWQALLWSGLICIAGGLAAWFLLPSGSMQIAKREGYLIVSLGWVVVALLGTLPYLMSGVLNSLADAFFEVVSGTTTTGASVINDIEAVPQGILYWRSLTQWIGGMGIIVFTVAIFPLLGIGGVELFVAESPGPTSDKLHPRISETAKRLWLIYVGMTVVLVSLLCFGGMTFYESINHAMATVSTGGFSTKNSSMAAYPSPFIQYTIIVFMFLAGNNFTINYLALKGRFNRVWASDEFRAYLATSIFFSVFIAFFVKASGAETWEKAFRDSAFQVVSVMTTTGFVSADYTAWGGGVTMLIFILLFVGGCAGSTSGGIKMIRHLVFIKNSYLEFKRLLHPQAIVSLKLDGQNVRGRIITHIIIFLLVYLITFLAGSVVLSFMGLDFLTAIGATATCLGNVGPGIGEVGPVDNFSWLAPEVKWVLSFLMLLGRLELFTILVLFTPFFWRSN
jgi:trk system potassium uptake protein TrkH